MNWIKIICSQLMIGILLFTIVDYTYTNHFLSLNPFDPEIEKKYRVSNQFFHHSLKPNFKGKSMWGRNIYEICTDSNGFKSKCNNNFEDNKNFEIGFIGDSFTEAVGLPFDESFVGIFAENNQNLKIANLGVSSYSPTIYLEKIKWHLDNGYTFKHIIVFIDISDIQDEDYYSDIDNFNQSLKLNPKEKEKKVFDIKHFIKKNFFLSFFSYNSLANFLSDEGESKEKINNLFSQSRSSWTFDSNAKGYKNLGIEGAINRALYKMGELHFILNKNDIDMSLAVYPWPAQLLEIKKNPNIQNKQSKIWEKFCHMKCKNFIDIISIFKKELHENSIQSVYLKYYIKDDIHFNYEGNKLIYEQLKAHIK